MREFFVPVMNYAEAEADAVAVDDALLADAHRTSGASAGDVDDDLVARRNYTAGEASGFFADHMGYAAGEAAAMNIGEDASRERVAATAAAKAERRAYEAARAGRPPGRPAASLPLPRFRLTRLPFGTISATLRSLLPGILTNARFARLNPAMRRKKLIWNAPGTSRALKYTAHLRRACPNRQVQCAGMPARRTRTTTTRSRSRTSGTDRGALRACTL